MKKWISILMVMILALSMAACSSNQEAPATDGGGEAAMEEMPKIGVTIYKLMTTSCHLYVVQSQLLLKEMQN